MADATDDARLALFKSMRFIYFPIIAVQTK